MLFVFFRLVFPLFFFCSPNEWLSLIIQEYWQPWPRSQNEDLNEDLTSDFALFQKS